MEMTNGKYKEGKERLKNTEMIARFMNVEEDTRRYTSYGKETFCYGIKENGNPTFMYDLNVFTKPGLALAEFYVKAKYHCSWDWLFPVIEKIRTKGFSISFHMSRESPYLGFDIMGEDQNWGKRGKGIASVYDTVIVFLRHYYSSPVKKQKACRCYEPKPKKYPDRCDTCRRKYKHVKS